MPSASSNHALAGKYVNDPGRVRLVAALVYHLSRFGQFGRKMCIRDSLCRASELGCVIVPPMLTFYNGARTLSEQIDHIVGKVLLQFGLHSPKFRPWEGVED